MAVEHGRPATYTKHEASRQVDRIMWVAFVATTAAGLATGFALAYSGSWHALWGVLAAGVLMRFLLRLIDKPLGKLGRRRVRYLRGAQGEALVAWILKDLPDDWHVFHGMQLREASDIDHVVVGPGGLFCVSTKSHRGLFAVGPDGTYLLNERPTDFPKQAQRQAMQLRDRLAALLGNVPWVQPVLAAPLAWVAFDPYQPTAWVLHQDNLLDAIDGKRLRLKPAEVSRVVRALEMIAANAKGLYQEPVRPEARPDAAGGREPSPVD